MTQVQQKLVSMWKELLILNVQYLAHNYMFKVHSKTPSVMSVVAADSVLEPLNRNCFPSSTDAESF